MASRISERKLVLVPTETGQNAFGNILWPIILTYLWFWIGNASHL